MTDIKIGRLHMENFKCHKALTLDFAGGNASVYGDNATGKTSIYDALTWLLFGKDSAGNGEKNIEIKPLGENGEVKDHLAVTAVEACLLVNGEEVSLRRTYREVWSTKRGRSEATYDGNTSEYYVDGVPCKKNAFQERVAELVDEETFRMLTSVSRFASEISWQERRAVLFQVAGVQDDRQILESDERFFPLIEGMGKLSIGDYKKKLLAEKKKFSGAKSEIPARISECEKTIQGIEALDFGKARAALEELHRKEKDISAQMIAIDHSSEADRLQLDIKQAKLDLQKVENDNRLFRAEQNTGREDAGALRRELRRMETNAANREMMLQTSEGTMKRLERQIEDARNRWITANNEEFTGGSCPTCGQSLPAQQVQKAQAAFDARKQKRLDEIAQSASFLKEDLARTETRCRELKQEIQEIEAQIKAMEDRISAAEGQAVQIRDMDGYAEQKAAIQDRLDDLNRELADIQMDASGRKEDLRQQLEETRRQIKVHMGTLSKESMLDYSRKRVEELRTDARNAAECLDAIESQLFLMDEYSRYKTGFVEESINGMFRLAKFRLFREQANGGVEDRCDVVVDGVPYISVNNGMKINVGIDIINTLSMAYGVSVPLFVDNAESVTRLESCASQIIRLVVSEEDKELNVKYEN